MTEKEKIADKIRKLLAKAKDSSVSEAEAALFAEKAQALLAEHNLTEREVVKIRGEEEEDFIVDQSLTTDSLPWRRRLANATAAMYFCGYVFHHVKMDSHTRKCGYIRYDRHMFTGAPHNIEVAKMMFQYFNETIEREVNIAEKQVPVRERSAFRTSFKTAAAIRLANRIYRRINDAKAGGMIKTESGTTLPALASLYDQAKQKNSDFMQSAFGKLGKGRTPDKKHFMSHQAGVQAGLATGEKIGLDAQVANNKPAGLIGGMSSALIEGIKRAYKVALSEGRSHQSAIEYVMKEKGLPHDVVKLALAATA